MQGFKKQYLSAMLWSLFQPAIWLHSCCLCWDKAQVCVTDEQFIITRHPKIIYTWCYRLPRTVSDEWLGQLWHNQLTHTSLPHLIPQACKCKALSRATLVSTWTYRVWASLRLSSYSVYALNSVITMDDAKDHYNGTFNILIGKVFMIMRSLYQITQPDGE